MRVCQSEWDLLYATAVTQGGADTKIEITCENISFRVEKKSGRTCIQECITLKNTIVLNQELTVTSP